MIKSIFSAVTAFIIALAALPAVISISKKKIY